MRVETIDTDPLPHRLEAICFFPLVAGNVWTYDFGGWQGTLEVGNPEWVGGVLTWPVWSDDTVEYFSNDDLGLRYHAPFLTVDFTDVLVRFDPPISLSLASASIPSTRETQGDAIFEISSLPDQVLSYDASARLVQTEMVTTPAGIFEAVRLRLQFRVWGQIGDQGVDIASETLLFLAKDVGKVMESGSVLGEPIDSSLVSYDVSYDGLPCPEPAGGTAAGAAALTIAALARGRAKRTPASAQRPSASFLG